MSENGRWRCNANISLSTLCLFVLPWLHWICLKCFPEACEPICWLQCLSTHQVFLIFPHLPIPPYLFRDRESSLPHTLTNMVKSSCLCALYTSSDCVLHILIFGCRNSTSNSTGTKLDSSFSSKPVSPPMFFFLRCDSTYYLVANLSTLQFSLIPLSFSSSISSPSPRTECILSRLKEHVIPNSFRQ